MMLLLECKVESDTLIDEVIEWRVNSYVFKLYPSENKIFDRITVECKFPNYHEYLPKILFDNEEIPIIKFTDDNFYTEQVSMLQYIESFSSLDLGVKKIHWDNPAIEWVAETMRNGLR